MLVLALQQVSNHQCKLQATGYTFRERAHFEKFTAFFFSGMFKILTIN